MSGKVSSMTGFARTSGEADWGAWAWEAKSVNGRSMDVRVNVPSGFEALDRHIKQQASKVFSRGNLQVGLRIELAGGSDALSVNQDALKSLVRAYEVAAQGHAPDSAALATLMTVKGVIETGSASTRDIADEVAIQVLMAAGTAVLEELSVARQAEGAALLELMSGHLSDMETHVASATELAAEQPKLLKARLEKQLAELEAADKVAEGGAIGRKLDFLSQEFNREANTLCSKSVSMDLTNAGLALKGLIDQFKEQAANVE